MHMPQPFNTMGEQSHLFNGEKLPHEEVAQSHAQAQVQTEVSTQTATEPQWRRVLEVILVEGQIRYLVDRSE